MIVLAIDPGPVQSAVVYYDTIHRILVPPFGIRQNDDLLSALQGRRTIHLVIEMIASYGMPVGKTVFETCVWIGRFIQRWEEAVPDSHRLIYRKDVKMHLCQSARAKDSNVRQALIDKFPATGGGKTPQIGTKKQPGPLYGVSKDVWSALAVAVTYAEATLGVNP